MDYDRMVEELRRAWDALEEMSVKGYQGRMRVNTAQEGILAVYNAVIKAKKAEQEADERIADAIPDEA